MTKLYKFKIHYINLFLIIYNQLFFIFHVFSGEVNEQQMDILLSSVQKRHDDHQEDSENKNDRQTDKLFWEELSEKLNNEGTCIKGPFGWKRVRILKFCL